ncbi:hypothetical protein ACLB9X_14755 [Streptomyces sp. 5K101]|uniref:hypothetical protein n=1 Tax=Streptomyces sp. 5K101 TaxID=3390037 RepID=UPI00397660AE
MARGRRRPRPGGPRPHGDGLTHEVVFRRCGTCGQLNVVREDDFVCVFCEADLPVREA